MDFQQIEILIPIVPSLSSTQLLNSTFGDSSLDLIEQQAEKTVFIKVSHSAGDHQKVEVSAQTGARA
ncbi:hypothetical protein JCM33374_g5253 [Metschnikowia sp. JCM 33374]|nr:hypothetical protein JCM33374_g5253 [Metschnikowia sp. JCM 33374]